MFVVCVEFEIMPQYLDDFLAAMLKNAAKSYELELGCQQFDVCQEQQSRSRKNDVWQQGATQGILRTFEVRAHRFRFRANERCQSLRCL